MDHRAIASIGHIAVGASAGAFVSRDRPRHVRIAWAAAGSVLAFLPDADVISFILKIPYEAPWGHRGAPHSILFAGIIALAYACAFRGPLNDRRKNFFFAFGLIASHGIIDTFTDGGLGIALFWPFTTERYFAPWRPIPVAPIGAGFFSPRGIHVALTELLFFLPLFALAAWLLARKPKSVSS